ncbi:MAG: hypothetical protein JOY82_15210 [Streptosporangiaceae bacterium]|nr:hypothetical protein [Streptosporangiaceae bacterium]MBV9855840.1 hypothetical protein [Streptosporangiaceae bacterium]
MAPHVMHEKEWATLRNIRLAALRESPQAFLATYEKEFGYREPDWRAEFVRGEWTVEIRDCQPIALVGVTREHGAAPGARTEELMTLDPPPGT